MAARTALALRIQFCGQDFFVLLYVAPSCAKEEGPFSCDEQERQDVTGTVVELDQKQVNDRTALWG